MRQEAEPAPFNVTDATGTLIVTAAPFSYAATVGDDASDVNDPTGNGTFFRNSHVRISHLIDGTSTTVLLGERAWGMTNGIWAGAPNDGPLRLAFWAMGTRAGKDSTMGLE